MVEVARAAWEEDFSLHVLGVKYDLIYKSNQKHKMKLDIFHILNTR